VLYGAIFANDREMYDCNMQAASRRLVYVTDIISNRTGNWDAEYGADCIYDFLPLQDITRVAASQSDVINPFFISFFYA